MPNSSTMAGGPHFGVGSAIFQIVTPEDLAFVAEAGFPGIEMYRSGFGPEYLEEPRRFKDLLDRSGLQMITISNGGPGMHTEFLDPNQRRAAIDDHAAMARDVLTIFGCRHFKINMGSRPKGGTTNEQLKDLAAALTEIGKATLEYGIKLSPHPHIWGPVEREHEIRALMEYTDPRYVWLCPDTAHINLGGGDPLAVFRDYYDRIAAVHWKDSKAAYRGFTGPTPSREMHEEEILYKDLGSGGVDHEAIHRFLVDKGYKGWITLDLDPPRPAEGEGTPYEKLMINKRYLMETLGVRKL